MSARSKTLLAVLGLAALVGIAWYFQSQWVGGRASDHGIYYRLTAKYQHGDEIVNFDIVVGCNVRISANAGDSHSFDVLSRDPVYFVKATGDGGAVWQIVPDACMGQTTDNGQVPRDLLPGAIWSDRATDLTFGIAYVSEDAYENPTSKLKFLGASIHHATRGEWEQFQPINKQNLGSPNLMSDLRAWQRPKDAEELRANLWNKNVLAEWIPITHCYGVARFRLAEAKARSALNVFWPASKPRYWSVQPERSEEIRKALVPDKDHGGPLIDDGHYLDEHSWYPKHSNLNGFPTRSGGGTFATYRKLPSALFPKRADEGLPWFSDRLSQVDRLYRDVEFNGGANLGYLYCYPKPQRGDPYWNAQFGSRLTKGFVTRVDGETVEIDGITNQPDQPAMFFERDEYLYYRIEFWP